MMTLGGNKRKRADAEQQGSHANKGGHQYPGYGGGGAAAERRPMDEVMRRASDTEVTLTMKNTT